MRTFILLFLLALAGCQVKPTLLSNAEWFIGTWESRTSKGSLYETWTKRDEHSFTGRSYYMNNADTVLFETIELVEKDGKLLYIVNAPEEKHEKPVPFESTEVNENQFIFENRQHDFPQVILYRKIRPDSLYAEVSGTVSGKELKEPFGMRKIK